MKSDGNRRQGRPPVLDNARGRIVEEAAILFSKTGYEKSSIGSLAAAIGLSKAAIYHYFPTKQEIYDAIIVNTLQKLVAAVSAEIATRQGAAEQLRGLMCTHGRIFEENVHGFGVMLVGFGGMDDIDLHEAMQLRHRYEHILRDVLRAGISAGDFRDFDVPTTSRAILSMLNWMVRWYKPDGPRKAQDIANDYFELLMFGLRAIPDGSDAIPQLR